MPELARHTKPRTLVDRTIDRLATADRWRLTCEFLVPITGVLMAGAVRRHAQLLAREPDLVAHGIEVPAVPSE